MNSEILFKSIAELKTWLTENNVPFTSWGVGQSKSIENLFEELERGESCLSANPPVREVNVVQLIIKQAGNVLVEKEQILADNRIRYRSLPPSEKIHGGESWQDAAVRCAEEELQLDGVDVHVKTRQCIPVNKERESDSYPGLRCVYNIYMVEVVVPTLPQTDFWTNENNDVGTDTIIGKHLWGWVPENSVEFL